MKAVLVRQGDLTSDCWMIQGFGIGYCKTCDLRNTRDCGGKAIIKKIRVGQYPKNGIGKDVSHGN